MKVGPELLNVLNKAYAPDRFIHEQFGRYDLAFKTDDAGRPVILFLGKADADGNIKGEHFARRLQTDKDGRIVKDHWDNKGKA
jgi:hypothetical protein